MKRMSVVMEMMLKQRILIFLGSNLLQRSLCSKPHWSPFLVWLVSAAHAGVHAVRAVGKNRRGIHLCKRAKIRERRAGRRASAAASQQPHVGNTRGVRHGRGLDGRSNSRAPASTEPPEHSFRKMRARGRFQSTPPIGRGTKGRRPRRSVHERPLRRVVLNLLCACMCKGGSHLAQTPVVDYAAK